MKIVVYVLLKLVSMVGFQSPLTMIDWKSSSRACCRMSFETKLFVRVRRGRLEAGLGRKGSEALILTGIEIRVLS